MVDVDELAVRAVAPPKGRVKKREVQEAVAAALIVALGRAFAEAEELLSPERIVQTLSIRRTLSAGALRRLEGELALIGQTLRNLKPKICPDVDSGAPPRAD